MIRHGLGARSALGYGLGVSAPGGAAGNGLLNNLIAYWKLDEASGNAADAHSNNLTLTDTNTVTNAEGKVYATARQYTAANSEYHTRAGDDALLSAGDVEVTIAAWAYLDTKPVAGQSRNIIAKGDPTNEYTALYFYTDAVGDYWVGGVRNTANSATGYVSQDVKPVTLAAWQFLLFWHDPALDTINLQVNNGSVNTTAWSGGIRDTSNPFRIGGASYFWNGRIGPVAFWKSAAGGGGVLTAAQRTALWAGGAGLAYANFTT